MEEERKSNIKCNTNVSKKDSLVIVAMSLVLFALMFVRIEVVHRRAEVMEAKLEKRIQRIEDEMQARLQYCRESRERKVKMELLVLLEQKETLDVWARQAKKDLLD